MILDTVTRTGLYNVGQHEGVARGICVVIIDEHITYAGPIQQASPKDGCLILVNPHDFQLLRDILKKRTN